MATATEIPKKFLHACEYCGSYSAQVRFCCLACENLASRMGPFEILDKGINPFSHYDNSEFKTFYHQKKQSYLFFAEGLHCSSCVHLLEKLPEFYPEILSARVHFGSSTVEIIVSESASLAQVAYVIKELGYSPILLSPNDNLQDKYTTENRSYLKKIAVAGFCAGNTMLFVIPIYAGLAGQWAQVFNFLSFLLFLPILFYSAKPFYRGAWNSLKYKIMTVDLPIVIAMFSGFLLSTYNLFLGRTEVYYDSTASFLFLILSARYLLKRVQQNYLSPMQLQDGFQDEKFELVSDLSSSDFEPRLVPANSLKPGQTVKLYQGQSIPSDAVLVSAFASLDLSLFNGESMPRVYSNGMKVFAGSKVLDKSILIILSVPFSESKLGQLFQQLNESVLSKSPFVNLTDLLAQRLIITVFSAAILFFIIYFSISPTEAFSRSFALIIIACPCALAFGSPLTFALAMKSARKKGLLLKDSNTLEKLLKIKNVFFDKTGTLTEGSLKLSYSEPATIPSDLKNKILSLESPSYHPLAFALREAWPHPDKLYSVQDSEEVIGLGIRGKISGESFEIRTLSESTHESEIAIEVRQNNILQCRLYFSDDLRPDSPQVIQELQSQGLNCFLLSGDKKSRVFNVAYNCGINRAQAFGELYPEDKLQIISQYSDTCMIGDGANDSLSLKKSDVGIAVKGSVDLSLQSADIYLTKGGLRPVLELRKLAFKTRQVLIRNLSLSLIYNTLGGALALSGLVNPMLAAILMPISSVVIILSTLWGFR